MGVDQPYVRVETLRFLLAFAGSNEAVVPVDEGRRQVTCGVYRPAASAAADAALNEPGGSLRTVLDVVGTVLVSPETWRSWGEDGRSWRSVERPGTT